MWKYLGVPIAESIQNLTLSKNNYCMYTISLKYLKTLYLVNWIQEGLEWMHYWHYWVALSWAKNSIWPFVIYWLEQKNFFLLIFNLCKKNWTKRSDRHSNLRSNSRIWAPTMHFLHYITFTTTNSLRYTFGPLTLNLYNF